MLSASCLGSPALLCSLVWFLVLGLRKMTVMTEHIGHHVPAALRTQDCAARAEHLAAQQPTDKVDCAGHLVIRRDRDADNPRVRVSGTERECARKRSVLGALDVTSLSEEDVWYDPVMGTLDVLSRKGSIVAHPCRADCLRLHVDSHGVLRSPTRLGVLGVPCAAHTDGSRDACRAHHGANRTRKSHWPSLRPQAPPPPLHVAVVLIVRHDEHDCVGVARGGGSRRRVLMATRSRVGHRRGHRRRSALRDPFGQVAQTVEDSPQGSGNLRCLDQEERKADRGTQHWDDATLTRSLSIDAVETATQ
ncbi:hypothetical protein DFH11DRAFT_1733793 [Phellopilus nigrolimitatus]|nr:hypothetical protein DFH11DRAFT_1733793 [Phellopilus nigrolimitatus]